MVPLRGVTSDDIASILKDTLGQALCVGTLDTIGIQRDIGAVAQVQKISSHEATPALSAGARLVSQRPKPSASSANARWNIVKGGAPQ